MIPSVAIALGLSAVGALGLGKLFAVSGEADKILYGKNGESKRAVSVEELNSAWKQAKEKLFWWPLRR